MASYGWIDRLRSRGGDEEAQTMAEYAFVLGVIIPAIILGYALLSGAIAAAYDQAAAFLS
jgi:Flp pilus assembly pilin Flp